MNRVDVRALGIPLPSWERRLKAFARAAMEKAGADGWDLSLLLCGNREIAELNLRYRGAQGPTDVLSFAQAACDDGFPAPKAGRRALVGDLALSLDALAENARFFGVAQDEELRRLVIHGILHLGGMDHGTNDEAEPMLRLQEKILQELSDRRVLPKTAKGAENGRNE